ncbi:MAG: Calx-beta domain-containing protein, partial [Pirellulales bacterium]
YDVGDTNMATVTILEEPVVTVAATTPTTVEDGTSPGVFTLTRTGATDFPVTVSYTLGGTAGGSDYTVSPAGDSITIAAGSNSATIIISPKDDGDGDDNQSSANVVATLSAGNDYELGTTTQATVTINEEAPPVVNVVATTPTAYETDTTPGVFTISRSGPTDDPLTVSYGVSGTADGSDYGSIGASVTIPVGQSSAPVYVTPKDDGDGDDSTLSNTVSLTLSSSSAYTIGGLNSATVTIDEDFTPTVTISALPGSIAEVGGSGNFVVSLSAAAPSDITVNYGVSGSASSADYLALSGSVLVHAGHTSADILVTPSDDGDGDDNGQSVSVTATLQASSAYVVGSPSSATMTITEDAPPPTVTISATTATTTEGSGSPGVFTIYASPAPSSNLTVSYDFSGNAQSDDYSSPSSVVIRAGQTSATVTVTAPDDGDGDDGQQSVGVIATLASGTGYNVGSPNSATVTINEESPPPTVSLYVENSSTIEQNNSSPGAFMVSAYPVPTTSITVSYAVSGTPNNGTDYQLLSGFVTIPAGQGTAPIMVTPVDDGTGDDNQQSQYVTVTLTSGAGYTVGSQNSGTVNIYDPGGPPEMLSLPPRQDASAASVNATQVSKMVAAGAVRWLEAGMPLTTVIADLRGLRIAVQDLPGSVLGEAVPRGTAAGQSPEIIIDTNAAGYGWFVDRTPLDDSEFAELVAPSERLAIGSSPAVGRVDLLTVVMHEMGHLFGLPEAPNGDYPYDVMAETLDLSTRRFPLPGPPDVPTSLASTASGPARTATDVVFRLIGHESLWAEGIQLAQVAGGKRYAYDEISSI